jgi:hypothetical protein
MRFDVYCDESRPDLFTTATDRTNRLLVIGGIWLPTEQRSKIKAGISELKDKHRVGGPMKWQKVSPSRRGFYTALIDLFISFGEIIRFRCIAVEADKVNLTLFHEDDPELGFYKFYYQLVRPWLSDFNEYAIFCDMKSNRRLDRLHVLRRCLANANLASKVLSIQSLPSRESCLIQLADVLVGAAASRLNGSVAEGSTKGAVIQHLEQQLGHRLQPTCKGAEKFNIFKIRLQGGW